MAEDGRKISGADYLGALESVAAIRRLAGELFQSVDLVLTPTAAALPWPAEKPYPDRIDGKTAGPRDHAIFTGWVNIAGVPALIFRSACLAIGLPIGAQLVAAFGADDGLLAFARDVSRAVPPPPLPRTRGRAMNTACPAATSCKCPGRPTCRAGCYTRSRSRRSTIAGPNSPRSGFRS